jgi:hypothetical protein
MNHLEQLVCEYYDWQDYIVKKNIHVGLRAQGGYEMELDIVAYNPHSDHLVHVEASLDAQSWKKREERFGKKFELGRKYIRKEVFTWLKKDSVLEQIAILPSKPKDGLLCGMPVQSIDDFYAKVVAKVKEEGRGAVAAIPEEYPLLRVLQFAFVGYNKSLAI